MADGNGDCHAGPAHRGSCRRARADAICLPIHACLFVQDLPPCVACHSTLCLLPFQMYSTECSVIGGRRAWRAWRGRKNSGAKNDGESKQRLRGGTWAKKVEGPVALLFMGPLHRNPIDGGCRAVGRARTKFAAALYADGGCRAPSCPVDAAPPCKRPLLFVAELPKAGLPERPHLWVGNHAVSQRADPSEVRLHRHVESISSCHRGLQGHTSASCCAPCMGEVQPQASRPACP